MMCLMYWMKYEFNNWNAFYEVVEFIEKRHPHNYPTFRIEVPLSYHASTWYEWRKTVRKLRELAPDNLEEMSIYGKVWFQVKKDENLNNPSTPLEEE